MKYKFIEPEISKVEYEFDIPVYDLEIESDHSYCVGENIIAHNCSTKLKTGFTCPMFSCVKRCSTPIHDDLESVRSEIQTTIYNEIKRELHNRHPYMPVRISVDTVYSTLHYINNLLVPVSGEPDKIDPDTIKTAIQVELQRRVDEITSNRIPIIADGGMSENGDIVKAIRAGASMTMAGGMFAACEDSPAENVYESRETTEGVDVDIPHKIIKKRYYGSASEENKGHKKNVEGFLTELNCNGFTYLEKLEEIQGDLQSAISYAGGSGLDNLREVDYYILR